MINPIKIAHVGWAGIESSVGPIVAVCLSIRNGIEEKFKENILKLNPSEYHTCNEFFLKDKIQCFSFGSYNPKSQEKEYILSAFKKSAVKAILDTKIIKVPGEFFRPEYVFYDSKNLNFKMNFKDIFVMGSLQRNFGNVLCEIFAENIRRRFIESMCEMDPILKIYHLNENYGVLDKAHKKALKQNGPSAFHRPEIFILKEKK